MCLELYGECKELGRFMLRSSGHTIAAGVIIKVRLLRGHYTSVEYAIFSNSQPDVQMYIQTALAVCAGILCLPLVAYFSK